MIVIEPEQNQNHPFKKLTRTRTEPNPINDGSFPSLLAPLLHHQRTFHCNKSQYLRQSNVQVIKSITMLQTIFMSRCHVTANVNNHCHVICPKQNKASLHVKKKKYFFFHAKSPHQVITHASITDCFFVFLILSTIVPRPSTSKHFTGS